MNRISVDAPDFSLEKTLDCGQVFHWQKCGDGFIGAIGERAFYVEQNRDALRFSSDSDKPDPLNRPILRRVRTRLLPASGTSSRNQVPDARATMRHYFALDHPLKRICQSFPRDRVMVSAKDFCQGLRIIRQPKWECLATFICSSMKQVAHIRQISLALRARFGEPRTIADAIVHTFPAPERLAGSSEAELRKCALGYRAKNLLGTARLVAGDVDLEQLASLADDELRAHLCRLPGVGAKVANCVMLFAYERLRAFPIDVWIERILRETYFPRARKLNGAQLKAFTDKYFGEHGGYAQQYLFHHARTRARRSGQSRQPANLSPIPRCDNLVG